MFFTLTKRELSLTSVHERFYSRPFLSTGADCEFQRIKSDLVSFTPVLSRAGFDRYGDCWLVEDLGWRFLSRLWRLTNGCEG